jgi:hypothetical protein
MVAGALPFAASDPMDWVHCHIASKPVPPAERLQTVPAPVSAATMKLAKTAEDGYQTAAGLTSDLRRCLADGKAGAASTRSVLSIDAHAASSWPIVLAAAMQPCSVLPGSSDGFPSDQTDPDREETERHRGRNVAAGARPFAAAAEVERLQAERREGGVADAEADDEGHDRGAQIHLSAA